MSKIASRFLKKAGNKDDSTPLEASPSAANTSRVQQGLANLSLDATKSISPATLPKPSVPHDTIGLFELSKGTKGSDVDVVAVHGLQGGAYKTWTHENGSLWLRDFLPTDLPCARIMTFGYDSIIAFSNSMAKLEDIALDLLNRLGEIRDLVESKSKRPIVFICHSLGGIVAKKALILANEHSSNPYYRDILENTKGIAFLGVPHKGSGAAGWANFAARLLKSATLGISTNTAIVKALRKDSPILTDISKQFIDRAKNITIYTFYETQKLGGVVVVDEDSARIGLPNEQLFPVDANHRTLCKIPSVESPIYKIVGIWVAKLTDLIVKGAVSEVSQSSKEQEYTYYEVPNRRVRSFVGREDILVRIDSAFCAGPTPRIAVLQGMGGQGKSQVALEYCHRKRNNPYSIVLWIDAISEETLRGSYQSISERLKTPADYLPDTNARKDFVIRTLSHSSSSWLLIFDNYDDPNAFPNIQDFFPQSEAGAILVTSRHSDTDCLIIENPTNFIELHGLEESPALDLLFQQSGISGSNSQAAVDIVKRLGYHPLAITQAGAYIRKRQLKLCDFMDHYGHRKKTIWENTSKLSQYRRRLNGAQEETSLNVFTTWELSFQQLQSQTTRNSIETRLLTLFAFFDHREIPEWLFTGLFEDETSREKAPCTCGLSDHTWKLPGWLAATKNSDGQRNGDLIRDILISLRDLSLLQALTLRPDGSWTLSLHPLVKDWIRLRTETDFWENTNMAAAIVGMALQHSYIRGQFRTSFSTRQIIFLHAVAQEENYTEHRELQLSLSSIETSNEYRHHYWLFVGFFKSMGAYDTAEIISRREMMYSAKVLGPEHQRTMLSMKILAWACTEVGKWTEAEELQLQVVNSRKKVLGEDHLDTIDSISSLSLIYLKQDRLKEAEELQLQVVNSRKRVLDEDHSDIIRSIDTLALMYRRQDRLKEAEELQLQVVNSQKKVLGEDHLDTIDSIRVLSLIYFEQDRLKEAEELQLQAVNSQKKVLGEDHLDTMNSISSLAATYSKQDRFKEAEELYRQVLRNRKKVLGPDHLDTIHSMHGLAETIQDQERWPEAETLQMALFDKGKALLGENHPGTLHRMAVLAVIWQKQGRGGEALPMMLDAFERSKIVLGPQHPLTIGQKRRIDDWEKALLES